MKKLILFCTLLIFGIYPVCAQNLVPNPGFEAYKNLSCNVGTGQEFISFYLYDWTQPTPTSTDYWNVNNNVDCFLSPYNNASLPRTGECMAGIITYHYNEDYERNHPQIQLNYREYLQVELLKDLLPEKIYYASFYAKALKRKSLIANNLGMYFLDSMVSFSYNEPFPEPLPFSPQIIEEDLIDTVDWVKVGGCFIPDRPKRFLLIGNFKDDISTSIVKIGHLNFDGRNSAYYLIDDVSVIELPYNVSPLQRQVTYCDTRDSLVLDAFVEGATGYHWENGSESSAMVVTDKIDGDYSVDIFFKECSYTHTFTVNYVPDIDLGADTVLCRGQQFLLAPDYSAGAYQWYDGSSDSAKVITEPGDYWVSVPSFCAVRDTVRVGFIDCPGFVPNAFTPNGDGYNQSFRIPNIRGRGWTLAVFNRWGQQVYFSTNYKNDWEGEGLSPGVYYYTLSQSELNKNLKGYVQLLK